MRLHISSDEGGVQEAADSYAELYGAPVTALFQAELPVPFVLLHDPLAILRHNFQHRPYGTVIRFGDFSKRTASWRHR